MLCPVCDGVEMFVLEFELVEVDFCPECRGVWLDSGELQMLGERAGAMRAEFLSALEQQKGVRPSGGGKRRCPVCRKGLLEVQTPPPAPVTLDRCPRQDGLWFDRGELAAVVSAAGAEEGNVLARFFAELGGAAQE